MKEKKSFEILVLAENNNGYISVKEAKQAGIAQQYLVLAEDAGQFVKVARGLYVKKGYPIDPYYILQFTYKKAVFSSLSALYLHNLIEERKEITVNLPRGYLTHGIKNVFANHVSDKEYYLGQGLAVSPNGHLVETYDLERTFLDAFRKREELNLDMKDIFHRFKEKEFDKEKLLSYAKELGIEGAAEAYLSLL